MRFLLRRLVFYVIALWAAITLNFLLPRLMPGSPLDGLIANYGEQIRSNPQILQQLKASLGSADEPIWQAYPHYLRDIATGDFGVSFAKQAPVGVIIGNTLPWSIFLVGVGFLLSFIIGTTLGMLAAWRRGGITDNVATPVLMTLQSFPAFFLSLVAVYFLGLKLGWFPIQHAYSNDAEISFSTSFMGDAIRHAQLPVLVIIAISAGGWLLGMRNVMITTIGEDYVAFAHAKGLSDRRVMTQYAARNAILPPLTGFASFFASAVGGLILVEVVFSYPGVGLTLQQAALGHDYAVVQALLLVLALCVLVANFIMDCLYVVLDPEGAVGLSGLRRRTPESIRLLLANPKSRFGIVLLLVIVFAVIAAPLLTSHLPTEPDSLPRQPPSFENPFGTTDQGYNVFAQVLYGGRTSLGVAAIASVIAMSIAITLGLLAAYSGGWVDDVIVLLTNIFLVIPILPLLIVVSSFLEGTGPTSMALIIGLTSWAIETRILRGQALSLRGRDFILAAKVAGESTPRVVFGELMPNMLSRIAAGFAFVFVQAVFYEAALEFLGFGDANQVSWGTILFWATNNSTLLTGEWWHFLFPGLAISLTILAIVFINYGIDELSDPRLRQHATKRRRRWLTAMLWRPKAAT